MPLFIRIIAQRIALFILSFLAFLGINPDIHIQTPEEIKNVEIKQEELILDVLTPQEKQVDIGTKSENLNTDLQKISQTIERQENIVENTIGEIIKIPTIEKDENSNVVLKKDFIEDVVVNIVCLNKTSNIITMTTGSGVIVSPSGLVLTNSHVANNFLFDEKSKDSYKNCTIRRENIPTYGFNAKLVFLSEDWLRSNISFFTNENPKGSGENDYALLAITSNTNPVLKIPETFNYVNLVQTTQNLEKGDEVLVAAYPGVNSGIFEKDSNASLKQEETFIADLATFNKTTIDVVSTGPNIVAKKGSSGGGVFKDNQLLGIIVTTDNSGYGDFVNAITLPYIINDFKNDNGEDFSSFIKKDKNSMIYEYLPEVEILKGIIANFI